MLAVTTSDSHASSQELGVRYGLADVFLWQVFQMVCSSPFNSSFVLAFGFSL